MAAETMTEYMGVEFESPLVSSAGYINGTNPDAIIRDVENLAETGIAAMTVGSFGTHRRIGNQESLRTRLIDPIENPTVDDYNEDTGEMTNSMGLPGIGIMKAVEISPILDEAAGDKHVIYSVSPATDSSDTSAQQAIFMVDELHKSKGNKPRFVEVNVSCQNVLTDDGGRKPLMGFDLVSMEELLHGLEGLPAAHDDELKLSLKLPPYIGEESTALQLAGMLRESGVFDGVVTSNTLLGHRPLRPDGAPVLDVPGGMGGLSGPATWQQGQNELWRWLLHLQDSDIEVSSTLGIYDGAELADRLDMGAKIGGGVTRFWIGGDPRVTATEMLSEYAASAF